MYTVISKDGTPIAYDKVGDGPPLVLVEGALNDMATTMPLAALLRRQFTVFAYDRRGRGASGDNAPYAVEREIEDLASVIGEAGGSAYVFANCSGGSLALEAAACGVDVLGAVLYEPPYFVDGRTLPPNYSQRLRTCVAEGRRGDALELFMRETVQLPGDHVDDVKGGPIWPALQKMAHTLVYDDLVMGDSSLPAERMAHVTLPTLVIDGAESPEWARSSVQALVDALPGGRRYSLPGHTHFLVPEAVAPVISEFLSGLDTAPDRCTTCERL
ncbi:MAG: alpha/beta fold hydrolase [Actinophytocola sp.]|uniref:alpha/beta fold hydrolase n=1 Tax=Actinophytocola sp. TaxID=1872138 RepID=UPI00132B456D|nr:alpha/beta hydrolase [Actinophytocola sp.]MPZ81297.1 alpha/beta fold hydrolase [Actinophytocola sp.]